MEITLPTYIDLPRKRGKDKRVYITFNSMKGQHHIIYNQVKHAYHDIIRDQLSILPTFEKVPHPCKVVCTYYITGQRECDIDNAFLAVKFANDSIVSLGYLTDDSYKYVKEVTYKYGGCDKHNPRYEVEWFPI